MKKLSFIALAFYLLTFVLVSCERTNESKDVILGKCEDNIKLSPKEMTLDSKTNTVEISTQSTSWRLEGIIFNGEGEPSDSIKFYNGFKNFTYIKSEYQVERKEDGKKIKVIMNENTSNRDRSLIILVQQENCFDRAIINQLK